MAGHDRHLSSQNGFSPAYNSLDGPQGALSYNLVKDEGTNRFLARVPKIRGKDMMMLLKSLGRSVSRLMPTPSHEVTAARSVAISLPQDEMRVHEQTLPSVYRPRVQRSTIPTIQRQSLGTPHEALSSHPVAASLVSMEERLPARRIILQSSDEDKARELKAIKAERRKGRIFLPSEIPKNFHVFPDPDSWHGEHDGEEIVHDRSWEDAGIHDDDQAETGDSSIPRIVISEPSDQAYIEQGQERSLLSVDRSYEVLWHEQKKAERRLKGTVYALQSLACLVAEATEANLMSPEEYEDALRVIISDREELFGLFPLAEIVATDQKVDIYDFKALPHALHKILSERDGAVKIANYERMMRKELERELAEMRRERDGDYSSDDSEDYMRLWP
ncbi:hypothetical protein GGR54DRAFT_603987 [Hypoxylon sp. NC1633]|nr:hypothetical protein GGR54DRAFT_603987 [Hypoxylon sp. NC1633]